MSMSVNGLATGLDTKSIIDQLLSIDSAPKTKLEWNRALWDARKNVWGDLNTRLNTLQTRANDLLNPASWTVFSGVTSSNATQVTATTTGAKPAAGTYTINVNQLATTGQWDAASNLPAAVAGVRQTGSFYRGAGLTANSGTLLTGLRNAAGAAMGINAGSQVTMAWQENGKSFSSTYNVTAASTLGNLQTWAQSQVAGSSVSLNGSGQLVMTSPSGTAGEVTSLSFSAVNSAGTALPVFNGHSGASSSIVTAATDGGATANDTLQITQGAKTWYVNVAKGDNEAALVNKINAVSGIGVSASLSAGRLKLASNASGAAGDFTVSSSGGTAAALGLAHTTTGVDASFDVNGVAKTSATNTGVGGVITDVSLNLLGLTAGTPVSLTVGQAAATTADMKKKIMDFVSQYNDTIDFINSKSSEQKVVSPKTLADYVTAPLSRDYSFTSTAFTLRSTVGDSVSGAPLGYQMLSDVGITSGAISSSFNKDNTTGKLVVDETKLEAALNTDPTKVKNMLTQLGTGPAGEVGIVKRVSNLVSSWRTGGMVDSSMQGASSQVTSLQKSIDAFQLRLDNKKAYYQKMFTAMESMIGKMQQQSSSVSGAFSQMSAGFMPTTK